MKRSAILFLFLSAILLAAGTGIVKAAACDNDVGITFVLDNPIFDNVATSMNQTLPMTNLFIMEDTGIPVVRSGVIANEDAMTQIYINYLNLPFPEYTMDLPWQYNKPTVSPVLRC